MCDIFNAHCMANSGRFACPAETRGTVSLRTTVERVRTWKLEISLNKLEGARTVPNVFGFYNEFDRLRDDFVDDLKPLRFCDLQCLIVENHRFFVSWLIEHLSLEQLVHLLTQGWQQVSFQPWMWHAMRPQILRLLHETDAETMKDVFEFGRSCIRPSHKQISRRDSWTHWSWTRGAADPPDEMEIDPADLPLLSNSRVVKFLWTRNLKTLSMRTLVCRPPSYWSVFFDVLWTLDPASDHGAFVAKVFQHWIEAKGCSKCRTPLKVCPRP